jgi:CheY-like chemotaxis protein
MNKGRILLVDDMPSTLELADHMLTNLGYQVSTAQDAAEAIVIVEGGQGFDILVSDICMPNMSGVELARIVSRRIPNIKVLFTSGFPNATPDEFREFGASHITKPYRKKEMAEVLARLTAL